MKRVLPGILVVVALGCAAYLCRDNKREVEEEYETPKLVAIAPKRFTLDRISRKGIYV